MLPRLIDRIARRAVAAATVLLTLGGCTREQTPPNLVVVVIDTLRADHLGAYGYERPTSPNLDRFAAEGVLFENAVAPSSWTAPSIASLFTSMHPSVHGVTMFNSALPNSAATLAEVLQRQNFQTAGLSANFVHIIERKGFARGFDTFVELHRRAVGDEVAEFVGLVAADAGTVTTRAIDAAKTMYGRPFFLYIHYMDPHSGYTPPEPFRSRFAQPYTGSFDGGTEQLKQVMQGEMAIGDADMRRLIDLYDGEIAYTDAELGRLFQALRELELFDDSVIAILSDHGEEFGDHGGVFHGITLYDEMIRVPLLLRLPEQQHAGARISDVASIVDLGPTLIELVGAKDDRSTLGKSFAGLLAGTAPAAAGKSAFSELHPDAPIEGALRPRKHRTAITTRDWSWIGSREGAAELYDRRSDPRQKQDQAQAEIAVAASLAQDAKAFSNSLRNRGTAAGERVPLRPQDREQMRALGYLR